MPNKKPRSNSFARKKEPKTTENPESFYSKFPSWRFSKVDDEHEKWSFIKNSVLINKAICDRLSGFEKQAWKNIIGKESHFISIGDLTKEAQDRIEFLGLQYDELFSLRINSRERMFGIIEDGVMFFLWYDEKHEICPSHKKHT